MMNRSMALMAAALACAVAPLQAQNPGWPPVSLTAHRDSFVIVVQGQPRGTTVFNVETLGDSAHITEKTMMGDFGKQDAEIFADVRGHVARVVQASSFAGQQAMVNVEYAGGHAKGTAIFPGRAPMMIDAAVPASAVDDNVFQALLPGLPWKEGAKWDFQVFSPANNAVTGQTLVVGAIEKVTVPAGTFDAYKVELQAQVPVTFWISAAAPHRVLKVAPNGQPFSLERAN